MLFYVIFSAILLIFGGLNYYVGLRAWQWFMLIAPGVIPQVGYWLAFGVLALAFFLARLTAGLVPVWVSEVLATVGGYWLALIGYAFPLLLLVDVLRLLNRWFDWAPDSSLVKVAGTAVCVLLVGLLAYGSWRARTPVVTDYEVAIAKPVGSHQELEVVLISDTHLGPIIGKGRVRQLVEMVNALEPDLVLIAGDIIDDDFRPFVVRNMAEELAKLQAPLGVYGILGNHDDGAEDLPTFRAELARAGIQLLVDEWVKVDDSFYVVGRNDSSRQRRSGAKPLAEVMEGVDRSLPILLMDHQPDRLDDAVEAGVDLQVSGHTHRGQLWPGSLITERIFEVDWGYLKKGDTQFVVSLGWGTWGPPMRIGNRPEVVRIQLSLGGPS